MFVVSYYVVLHRGQFNKALHVLVLYHVTLCLVGSLLRSSLYYWQIKTYNIFSSQFLTTPTDEPSTTAWARRGWRSTAGRLSKEQKLLKKSEKNMSNLPSKYNGDLNTGWLWYSIGRPLSSIQTVNFLNGRYKMAAILPLPFKSRTKNMKNQPFWILFLMPSCLWAIWKSDAKKSSIWMSSIQMWLYSFNMAIPKLASPCKLCQKS